MSLTGTIGINRNRGFIELGFINGFSKWFLCMANQWRMEGSRNRQLYGTITIGFQLFQYLQHLCGFSGDHNLIVRVVVGDSNTLNAFDLFGNGIRFTNHGNHGAGVKVFIIRCRHRLATGTGKHQVIFIIQHTCRPQCCQFTKAVACGEIGLKTCLSEGFVQPHAQCANGGLCMLSQLQFFLLPGTIDIRKNRNRINGF